MPRVLVIATSRKTRGGITSVVKAHEQGEQWKKYHCKWIETHRDGAAWRKILYFVSAFIKYICLLPFYDIVHIHIATIQSAKRKKYFFEIAKTLKKKTILHFHPSNEKFLYNPQVADLYRDLFERADLVLVLSEQWRRWLKDSIGNGSWMNKMEVLYNPCPSVHRSTKRKKKQILYAGTLLRRKGYDVLLKAFGKIAKIHPDWKIAFAGNPYLKEGINELEDGKDIARRLNIESQVEWFGWVSGDEKERVFNESSIYCLASDGEGFPMGVLDAWAYGLPCVVTPVGGLTDIVIDGKNGLVFSVGNVDMLAEKLDLMISDSQCREQIAQESLRLAQTTFDVKAINEHLGRIYEGMS